MISYTLMMKQIDTRASIYCFNFFNKRMTVGIIPKTIAIFSIRMVTLMLPSSDVTFAYIQDNVR